MIMCMIYIICRVTQKHKTCLFFHHKDMYQYRERYISMVN